MARRWGTASEGDGESARAGGRPAGRDGDGPFPDHPELAAGRVFPDLELADHGGNQRRLGELIAGDPTFLHFFRGWWRPKEQAFLRRLVALQDEAEVAYCRFVSVSVDPPPTNAAFRAGLGARWTFLSDPDRVAQRRLRLREATDTVNDPYVPAAFCLYPDRTIHAAFDGYWFWGRPTNEEIRQALRRISGEVRDDWHAPAQ